MSRIWFRTWAAPTKFGQNIPVFHGDAGAGYGLSAPQAGTITSWKFLSGGVATGSHFELAVLVPVDQAGQSWRLLATSAPVAISTASATDAVDGPFPVSIPIDVGERIALMPVDDSNTPIETGTQGVDAIRYFSQSFSGGLGSSQHVASTADNGQVVPIQATIGADQFRELLEHAMRIAEINADVNQPVEPS